MKMTLPPQAKPPSVWNLRWLGGILALAGASKVLDALFVNNAGPYRDSNLYVSAIATIIGLLMVMADFILRRPRPARRSIAEIREAHRNANNSQSGFTLLEILVALGLMAMVFSMIAGVLLTVLNTSRTMDVQIDQEKIGHGVLSLLQRELQGCVSYGMGTVVFKAEDKSLSGNEADEVFFVTTAPGDVFDAEQPDQDPNSGVLGSSDPNATQGPKRPKGPRYRKVSYVLRPSPNADSNSGQESFVLCRRALAYSREDRDVTSGGAPYVEVVDGLLSFNLEFQDGPEGDWANGWSSLDHAPTAIRITVTTTLPPEVAVSAREDGLNLPEPKRYQTIVSILTVGRLPEESTATSSSSTSTGGS